MNTTESIFVGFVFGGLLVAILLFSVGYFAGEFDMIRGVQDAVKACEVELPRHLECVPVYGASVVE